MFAAAVAIPTGRYRPESRFGALRGPVSGLSNDAAKALRILSAPMVFHSTDSFQDEAFVLKLQTLCYVASFPRILAETELEAMREDGRAFNGAALVTGVLLHDQGSFFHYFEGLPADVDKVYRRAKESHGDTGIVQLLREPSAARVFLKWRMGSTQVSKTSAITLQTADWRQLRERVGRDTGANLGIMLLRKQLEALGTRF